MSDVLLSYIVKKKKNQTKNQLNFEFYVSNTLQKVNWGHEK